MKVWDTVLLGSCPEDLDMLECRLREMDQPEIYRHVIVEGDLTFTGVPKPLYYAENQERFAPWADRIRYVSITPGTLVPGKEPGEAWAREHASRQACRAGLGDAEPDDLIIHGDVDEILTSEAVAEIASRPSWHGPVKLLLKHYSFAVDWKQPWLWPAPSVAALKHVGSFTDLRESGWPAWDLPSGNPAGWHLSWMGGPEAHRAKARSFAHTEAAQMILEAVESGKFYEQGLWHGHDPFGKFYDWEPMIATGPDEPMPRYVSDGLCPRSWFRPR
jgi:beta-1,4-mannosyl-glycoprotein beta-1,4-N-acetylglucosaminyltransferase